MHGTFWIFLRKEVQSVKGTGDEYSRRDKKLMHRDPEDSTRYGVEFDNLGGLNLWKHPYQYYAKARIRDSPKNLAFKKILERNITSKYKDKKGREVVEVSQKGAEAALNNTIWLEHWNKKTGKDRFYVVLVPQHVYVHRMSKNMFSGWVKYNPKLVELPKLLGTIELEAVTWKQERLFKDETTIRDIFEGS